MLGINSNKSRTCLELAELLSLVPDGPPPPRPPRRRRRLSTRDAADIVLAYQAGATGSELASKYGINRRTVSAVVARGGASLRYRLIGSEELAQAIQQYESGRSLAEIARELGVSRGTVCTALRAAGVVIRDSHGRSLQ